VTVAAKNLDRCSDEELLRHFQRGESEAFGLLLRRYEREMYGYLCRYVKDAALAEDVFQNTFLQVYLKSGQYEAGRRVRPWLYTIATHQAIDAMRRKGRHLAVSLEQSHEAPGEDGLTNTLADALEGGLPDPLDVTAGLEQRDQVRAWVDSLPDLLRHVLILAYYQGLKYREVADVLGIPVGTVKSRLHAALTKLQEAAKMVPTTLEE